MTKNKKKFILVITSLLIFGIALLAYLFWDKLPLSTPQYAKGYSVAPLSCSYQEKACAQISFNFTPSGKTRNQIPKYDILEFPDRARTIIIFHDVDYTKAQFTYNEVAGNPLIENLDYNQEGTDFIVKIQRKGAFLPAEITQNGSAVNIILKEGDQNYPLISDQKPADNSAAYPAFRKISFKAVLQGPLEKAVVLFQNRPVEFSATEIPSNQYLFSFNENIEKDKEYFITAIITDDQNRISVSNWTFEGQIPVETVLGKDRFKYLGWWGQINTNGISVREKPERSSKKLDTFSSLNRVKVLNEVYGETVNENALWYEIDGGKYPHAYVFSEYVTPMIQPEPPQVFTIPEGVKEGEYWIDVDLTKKFITLFTYDTPIFSSYFSPGREKNPTIEGTFRVWYKLIKARMQGGPPLHDYKYDLTDVPYVLYYNGSYAIHGTYWHDKFGVPQSAGCTNLTQGDAAFIFDKVNPKLKPGEESIFSSKNNPGTVVYNHY